MSINKFGAIRKTFYLCSQSFHCSTIDYFITNSKCLKSVRGSSNAEANCIA